MERAWGLACACAISNGEYTPAEEVNTKMAKDGTNRGGARVGAGAKKKPLADKIAQGNPGKRTLTVIDSKRSPVLRLVVYAIAQ